MGIKRPPGRPRERRGRRGAFAESLRDARRALGLTQHELAAELCVSHVTVAYWETGSRPPGRFARAFVERWIEEALREAETKGARK